MWLYDSIDEIDLKVNKAMHHAKRAIMRNDSEDLLEKIMINAAGQEAIKADILSESVFLRTLEIEGLSGILYSEESGIKKFGSPKEGDELSLTLLLDPLDGSQNYLKGLPFGCISVAYGSFESEPKLEDLTRASIMNLYAEEVYYAAKGAGAYFNGNPIPHINERKLKHFEERSIQISYYAYGAQASKYYFEFEDVYALRSLGSAAWELAMVAENRNDAFADIRGILKAHDFAGAKIIIEEVGGLVKLMADNQKLDDILLGDFKSGYSIIASSDHDLLDFLLQDFEGHGLL